MKPQRIEIIGNELVVVWDDGHESYYPLEQLRRNCPCAGCSGESDLFGRVATAPPAPLLPQSFELISVDRVGNYGIQPNWADRHTWGIWTYDRLRAACPCDKCRTGVSS